MNPDENSVNTAAGFINRVKNGETVTQDEITASMMN